MKEIEKEICSICGKELSKEEINEFDGKIMCKHCLDSETSICESCHTRIWNDDSHGDEYVVLCKSCYNNYYTRCGDCGCIIHLDNANYLNGCDTPYCDNCFEEMEDHSAIIITNPIPYFTEGICYIMA